MTKLLIPLLTFYCVTSFCQLSIRGRIIPSSLWEQKLYVIRIDKLGITVPVVVDSIVLQSDGSFDYTFDGNPQGLLYELRQPPKGGNFKTLVSGFNDNWFHVISSNNIKETIRVTASADSLYYSLQLNDSKINYELMKFKELKRPVANKIREMTDSISRYPSRSNHFKDKYASIVLSGIQRLKVTISQWMDTCNNEELLIAGLFYLSELNFGQLHAPTIKKYADRLTNNDILFVRNIKRSENDIERNRIGLVVPNVKLRDAQNKASFLYSLGGKYRVVDFWASWCGPCRLANKSQLPKLNAWLTENGIPLIAISIDKDESKWKDAVDKDNTQWYQFIEPEQTLSKFLDIGAVPHYIVLDVKNVVVFEAMNTYHLEQYIKENIIKY